jgi:hypothetical protein
LFRCIIDGKEINEYNFLEDITRKILLFFYLLQFSLILGRNQLNLCSQKKKKKETRRFIFLSFSFDFLFLFLSQINKRDLIFFFTLLLFPFLFLKTYKLQVFAIAWFKIFETLSNNYNTNPLINWSYISNGIYKNILCFLFWES